MTRRRLLTLLACAPVVLYLAAVLVVRQVGPPEAVLAGADIPPRIAERMRALGRFAADEQPRFFYSDAVLDIDEGFCFVSDRRVGAFVEGALQAYPLDEVEAATLVSDTAPLVDSSLTIRTRGGEYLRLHLSKAGGGDAAFRDAVLRR